MDFSGVQLTPNEAQLASWCKEAYKNRKKEATQISSLAPSPRRAHKRYQPAGQKRVSKFSSQMVDPAPNVGLLYTIKNGQVASDTLSSEKGGVLWEPHYRTVSDAGWLYLAITISACS